MQALDLAVPLAVAFGVAWVATPFVVRLANSLGVLDRPGDRSVNLRSGIPLLGGLAVALGFGAGLGAGVAFLGDLPASPHLTGLLIGGAMIIVLGVWDDHRGLSALPKFTVQIAAAAVAISYDYTIDHLTDPVSGLIVHFPAWLTWIVTTLWIVGITNAVNLVDGLDGLATGVGAIIGATLTVIAWQAGQPIGGVVGVALVGALLGFLPFNYSPARIFLGDTGSLFIGYVLALVALESYKQVSVLTFVVPLLALAVPILDTLLSILRRLRLRAPIFTADRLHMHHRLLDSEGSPRGAVLQFYFLTAAFCLIAVSFTRLHGLTAALFLTAVVLLTIRLLWNIGVFSLDDAAGRKVDQPPPDAKEKER
jgi:UDP-GlcNAc:undecaprenyl-phosphate GlcNAc-1-phosphate transferase